jgi:hypothetical protein
MAISYVQLLHPINVDRGGSLESWSRERNGSKISVVERGPWIIFQAIGLDGKVTRVPMSNIGHITEDATPATEPAPTGKGAK